MRLWAILFILFVLTACQTATPELNVDDLKIKSAADNPCIECTTKVMAELAACKKSAGTDPVKLAKCDSIYSAEWTKRCSAICTNPSVTAQEETPRMKCLREAQEAHLKCLSTAKTPAQKKACNDALAAAIQACPPPNTNGQH